MTNRLQVSLLALIGIVAMSGPTSAQLYNSPTAAGGAGGASKTAPQTCDPDYWHSMTAKAWMEAEREIIQNKNLIYKPDSVMEYVCFDSFMQQTALHVGNIFTHTTYYNGQMIIPRGGGYALEQALARVVTDTYKIYIENNFNHKFLGERSAYLGKHAVATRSIGDASAIGGGSGGGPPSNVPKYQCSLMANIWTQAKCENFIDNAKFESDGFFPFDDIEKGPGGKTKAQGYKNMADPRQFPTACKVAKPDNANWTWDKAIPRSVNDKDSMYAFAKPVGKTYDDIRPKLEPGKCSGGNNKAIMTGITVVTDASGKGGYDDGVCSNPGCSFKKNGTCAQ